ncbi:beta strand repeat-containing protein [Methylobacter tundripaludum]|uniref:beta strand repeat-containing protein n=1 Tax=Methylobacter tundripaludum TaxID=173365 RepID=UPI00123717AB|nr:VCBS domain-containing protein [Methylobacter tundripaludum]
MYQGTEADVRARWDAATNSMDYLNSLHLPYTPLGVIDPIDNIINSNSAYHILGDIMGVPIKDFDGVIEPGLDTGLEYILEHYGKDFPPPQALLDNFLKAMLDFFFKPAYGDDINPLTGDSFTAAQNFRPKKDPLTLDLDGDGIETVPPSSTNPILFDHDGDGVKSGTGWIKADDGFLVLDRNGNGSIDDGTELFGDSTPLLDAAGNVTGKAMDGFDALAQQDSNGDGEVNSSDAHFAALRVWQDLNQDGISQAGELKTLDELGIAGINVGKTEHSKVLPGGNEIADLGTYTRTDGTTGGTGAASGLADVNLADDTFHREFTDHLDTSAVTGLPDMQGSGAVRDLREAASQSPELAATLAQLGSNTTREQLKAAIGVILQQWADSANFNDSFETADAQNKDLFFIPSGASALDAYNARYAGLLGAYSGINNGSPSGLSLTNDIQTKYDNIRVQQNSIERLLKTLEAFNGRDFAPIASNSGSTTLAAFSTSAPAGGSGSGFGLGIDTPVMYNMEQARLNLLTQSYNSLSASVYDALILQTRLKPYLDSISLTVTEGGIDLDFSALDSLLANQHAVNANTAVGDLLELRRLTGDKLEAAGWDGLALLTDWAVTDASDTAVLSTLSEFGYSGGIHTDAAGQVSGGNANDIVAAQVYDPVTGSGQALVGNGGNDLLLGGAGNDSLSGGTGNDLLHGGAGNDTYRFNLGDGADTIIEMTGDTGIDAIVFGSGILAGDLDISRDGDNLVFAHVNGKDRLVIANWFNGLADAQRFDNITFADGAVLQLDALQLGSSGNDTLIGTSNSDILMGGGGDDILISDGNDWLNGGSGADSMTGSIGDDIYVVDNAGDTVIELEGEGIDTVDARASYTLAANVENLRLVGAASLSGTGNELDNVITGNAADNALYGMDGNDTLIGNAGNDTLDGGAGSDTMLGGKGNDIYVVDSLTDTVTEQTGQGTDTIVAPFDYTLGANVENLTLTEGTALTGTGNELDNVLTGNSNDNILTGLAGNDTLNGGAGADMMQGGMGDDIYIIDNIGDSVVEAAGEGMDLVKSDITYTLTDNVENLTLAGPLPDSGQAPVAIDGTGNVLDNFITGNDAANTLIGLEGNDTLDGKGGVDTLIGGTGNDTYMADNAGDIVTENAGEGIDTVQSGINYRLGDNVENLALTGATAINGTGNALDNIIVGNSGNNILDGGIGNDSMAGGNGSDTYILDSLGDTIIEQAGQGTDTIIAPFDYTLGASVENLTLTEGSALTGTGNELDNVLTGNSNDNTLTGLAGNDTLDGGAGADRLIGGTGNDTYVVDSLADQTVELAGEGVDTVKSNLTWESAGNLDNLTLTGSNTIDGTGNVLDNVIIGNIADNTLTSLDGNDTLDGGAGADMLIGGTGNDTYVVDNSGDAVIENSDEGVDLVKSSITYTLIDNVENLTLTGAANINGTGNTLDNVIIGNDAANTLSALEGNDILNGGKGADTMLGGTGDDTYLVDNTGDIVIEAAGEGMDVVQSGASYTLSDNIETLTLTGTTNINGTGNTLDNILTGNSGDNVISGMEGSDTLYGNAGNDKLDGGAGTDTLIGGAGNDIYVVDDTADMVLENAAQGIDSIFASVDYALSDNVENLTLTGVGNISATGNTLNNVLIGNTGDNALYGMAGNDALVGDAGNDLLDGGTGNDVYVVDNIGDLVVENAGEGTDTVQSSIAYTLANTVENLTLTGNTSINGTGNMSGNVLIGNDGGNILSGLEGNDTLIGGAGNDTLDGGLGADAMAGGAGSDTYIVDDIGDVVTENVNDNIDAVQSSISYTLTDNVENLVLTPSADSGQTPANLDGTGNVLDNSITGTSGDNVLDGGLGIDTLAGGAGNDTYIVDNTADVVVENLNDGTDSVFASADYTLSDNIENLTLTGAADINGTGNALDNIIIGNSRNNVLNGMAGNDTLDGGAGVDTLVGGVGNDTYYVDDTADVVVENLNEGTDSVFASATYTLSDNIENLILTGTFDIDGTGNALNNAITGNSGANVLDGGAGADTMTGGAGNDTYIVDNAGDKTVEALNAGIDTVLSSVSYTLASNVENLTLTGIGNIDATGNELNNILLGNTGNNRLYGLAGNDTLIGNTGNDLLDGGTGSDSMEGNAGDDIYVVDNAGDVVAENADEGFDTVQSSISYTLEANIENLTLNGTASINGTGNALDNVIVGNTGNNVLSGLAGNDTLTGNAGNDTLDGGLDADSMAGGAGNDTYVVDNVGDIVTEGLNAGTDLVQSNITYTLTDNVENLTLTGTDVIYGTGNALNNIITGNVAANMLDGGAGVDTLYAGAGDDSLIGVDGNDALYGEAGNDLLQGNAGNDTLDGGLGADTMQGGLNNDTYVVDNIGDLVIENLNEGTDLVQSSITYTLTDNVENLTLTGTASINGTGNVLDNIILGNSGNNTLTGLEGNDMLNGGAGVDTMLGGVGDDTYVVDNAGDIVIENLGEGIDNVQAGISYTLTDNVENLTLSGTASINGTGNALDNVIVGNAGNNVLSGLAGNDSLTGNAGNDTLDGGSGVDSMAGGAGNDTYVVDNVGDIVTEGLNAGTDLVQSNITYTLTDNVENLTLTGADVINGTGNTLNNIITGNGAANVLDGGAGADSIYAGVGDDTLLGGTGNDILDGGTGADAMSGGLNDDTYVVDNVGDLIVENLNEGTDLVQSSITYTLTDNVENLTLTGAANIDGTGNALDNIILGNSGSNTLTGLEGNDTLNGGAGADTMLGGIGNDTYVVDNAGDIVIENIGEGTDLVQSGISYTLTDNVENLTLAGTASINGTGNALDNVIVGNTGNNILAGLDGNDTLTGNAGNDTLDGGSGVDSMAGGTGNDTYVVDNISDMVTEALNAGTDTVQSSISYTLGANVENLTLTGIDAINGTGNALNNTITGNAAANMLDGGSGADSMAGGAGDDTYVVDNSGDVVTEALNAGIDTVQSSITYTLGGNVENLTLTGTTAINGTGNALDNVITGNSAANVLDGGVGADNMAGGAGNDTYIVDNINDVIVEGINAGTDSVQSSVTYRLSDNVENLTLTGTAAINGTGNALDNVIAGNSGVNVLAGMGGNDTYYVDNTTDVIVENIGEGTDSVFASASYTLSDNVENLTLTGTAVINATGNALDNIITGNSSANVLDGGAGADTMAGGAGNDTYVVDNVGDVVTEALNAGMDSVQSSIGYTLGNNLENLVLTGTDALNATGNALNNTITGNSGNNLIDGGAGADTMAGGVGDDTYVVDNIGDVVVEADNAGIDTVQASASYTLASNIENLALTGAANINGTGNALDNLIVGNSGNNTLTGMEGNDTLDGGIGADTMAGGVGDDTYVVDNADDMVVEAANAGIDTVQSGVSYSLSDNVENLTLTGATSINAAGNALDNILTGNSGANVLDGGAGADTLIGGQGNDTLLGGMGNDRYVFNPGDGADIIIDTLGGDILYIGGNLIEANLEGVRDGDNMIVNLFGTTDSITLSNWFVQSEGVNRIEFGDGSSLDRAGIEGLLNRPPVAYADAITVYEDGGVVSVPTAALLANDTDPNTNDVISVVGVGASAIGATVQLTDGQVQYDIGNRFQELGAGQTVTDSFGYTISDSKGATASSVVNVTITGINDAAVTATDTAAVQEDLNITATGNVLSNDTDVDQGTVLSVANAGVFSGSYGSLTLLADGSYTYALDNTSLAVQSLAAGQTVTEIFDYQATDGLIATLSTLTVTITGTNDAPVTTVDTATVQEDLNITATGNVLSNDTDVDQGTILSVVDAGIFQGNYGQLTLNADGSYTYNVDNTSATIQSLGRTAQVSEHFDYTVTDGITSIASALDVYLQGTNDAPILVAPLVDQDFTFNKFFSWQMPSGSFADIDQGDTLDYSATLADSSPLPDWLTFDPITQTFSGMTPKTVGYLDIKLTATDRVAATGSTVDSLATSDIFRISISHGNEGVGNGLDAVPTGLATNFNDGTGTSTGNPGASSPNNNILQGGSGSNILTDISGNNLFDAGNGADKLNGGAGNELFIGGAGNDTITTGAGADIIALNRGDGQDTVVASTGADNTISLGGGIDYQNLAMSKSGGDLILDTGLSTGSGKAHDQIILKDWFAGTANRSVVNLQIVLDNMTYNPASLDTMVNQQVQNFDFTALAQSFDQALATNPTLVAWNLTDSLLTSHLAGSDTEALGGDLAYQYNLNGSLAGMGVASAQTVISDTNFGTSAQQLHPLEDLQTGMVRLS